MARPLRAFAIVEVLIAVSALLTPTLLSLADNIFVGMAPSLENAPILTTIARIGLTALVLIIPGALMGMTYPLVLRAASRTADGIRRTASLLYAINTSGAIVGVLFGSLWLVPTLGLRPRSTCWSPWSRGSPVVTKCLWLVPPRLRMPPLTRRTTPRRWSSRRCRIVRAGWCCL